MKKRLTALLSCLTLLLSSLVGHTRLLKDNQELRRNRIQGCGAIQWPGAGTVVLILGGCLCPDFILPKSRNS